MNSTPVLTDRRIESMRSTVMLAVDDDINRRGRRARRILGTAVAGACIVIVGGLGVSMLQGLGGGNGGSGAAGDSAAKSSALPHAASGDSATDSKGVPEAETTALSPREVITTGTVNLTVKHPREAAQRISSYVESIGGRVDSRSENGDGDGTSAFVEVRVPSSKVTATIEHLKSYGTVDDVSLQNEDVTAKAKDLDARIDALKLSITRLEKIMGDADTSAELIQAETALTQRQEQLESLQSQRKTISGQVELSTLSIDLTQREKPDSVSSGGFRGGLVDGWNALVATVDKIVEVAGVLLPWAAIAAVLYGAYRLVTRRRS